MITDAEILDVIPQEGAERIAQVYAIMRPPAGAPNYASKNIIAHARAVLAFEEWRADQSHEIQMLITLAISKVVKSVREARAKFKREAQEMVK